jgi:sec-independent protein translocase protein TatB
MFDIGFSELVVIGLIALIVLGPKRLPEAARTVGRWTGKLRRFVSDVKQDLDREMHDAELTELRKLKQELDQTRQVMQETSSGIAQSFTGMASDIQPNPSGNSATDSSAPALASPPGADKLVARAKRTKAVKSTRKSRSKKKHGRAKRHERT